MKKQKNQSRLKDQENSPERTNNETYHSNIIDSEFKKEIIKILKGLRKAVNRNAGYCKKELGTIKRNQEKLESSFAKMKAELKAINSKLNDAEERIRDLEDGIMEITQSEQQIERH